MRDAVIVEAVRTPIGKGKANGALHGINAVDLLAHSLKAVVERTGIDAALIDDVIGGAVSQVGEQSQNVTRTALLAAGYPESVPGTTVDRQCGSSQQAVHFAAQGVIAGAYDIVVAAGVESMSRVPMGSSSVGRESLGVGFEERYPDGLVPQGISAELIAAKWGLSRTQLGRVLGVESSKSRAGNRKWLLHQGTRHAPAAVGRRGHPPRHHGRDPGRPTDRLRIRLLRTAIPTDRLVHHRGQQQPAFGRQFGGDDHDQ